MTDTAARKHVRPGERENLASNNGEAIWKAALRARSVNLPTWMVGPDLDPGALSRCWRLRPAGASCTAIYRARRHFVGQVAPLWISWPIISKDDRSARRPDKKSPGRSRAFSMSMFRVLLAAERRRARGRGAKMMCHR